LVAYGAAFYAFFSEIGRAAQGLYVVEGVAERHDAVFAAHAVVCVCGGAAGQ
jgi:hypothetical protein